MSRDCAFAVLKAVVSLLGVLDRCRDKLDASFVDALVNDLELLREELEETTDDPTA